MRRILKRAELPLDFHPHSFRHSFASILLRKSVSVYYVSRQLGHKDIRTTLNRYGHWIPTDTTAAVNALESSGDHTPIW